MVVTATRTITVDDEDADLLSKANNLRDTTNLAREVASRALGPKPSGYHVDHIDNDWANNQRNNLQYLTAYDNITKNASNKYYGVRLRKGAATFIASVWYKNKQYYLGKYYTAEDAAYAVDNFCREHNLPVRNFPDRIITPKRQKLRKRLKPGISGFWGVQAQGKKWRATVWLNGFVVIGVYPDKETAAKAYDAYVISHGLDKQLNFPEGYK